MIRLSRSPLSLVIASALLMQAGAVCADDLNIADEAAASLPTLPDLSNDQQLLRPLPHPAEIPERPPQGHQHERPVPKMSESAQIAPYDQSLFGPDPSYADKPYDAEAQLAIYGGKKAVIGPRPWLEWGYKMYQAGPLGQDGDGLGEKNPTRHQLLVYGDWRTAVASNDNGAISTDQIATRLNLDLDYRFTATERLHVLLRPFDRDGRFTRHEFGGNQRVLRNQRSELLANSVARSAFFEGDLGSLVSGWQNRYTKWDLPFAMGLTPMFFQNGFWMDDAIIGGAASITARNNANLDISNYDITVFAGFDDVNSPALIKGNGRLAQHQGAVAGVAGFFERHGAYIETGYGYVHDKEKRDGDYSYHNLTAAYTKRYAGKLSNTIRVMANVGQDPGANRPKTADGYMVVAENSWITSKPYTYVPYANFFYAHGTVQSLARDPGAGGPLKNIGIGFETDGLTGFPLLDDRARNTAGAALGLQYLFKLDQQLVGELAFTDQHRDDDNALPTDERRRQTALSVRYQRPLSKQWILRADAIKGWRRNAEDFDGIRIELRLKF